MQNRHYVYGGSFLTFVVGVLNLVSDGLSFESSVRKDVQGLKIASDCLFLLPAVFAAFYCLCCNAEKSEDEEKEPLQAAVPVAGRHRRGQ